MIIEDPFNNRDVILGATKGKKGVYVWESIKNNNVYVGHSINLYNRISSYFMPSILRTKARRVLRYFNKHNFNDVKLIIYIMNANHTTEEVVEFEQYLIDTLRPNLNVDLVASNSGYHVPMSSEIRDKLRIERGTAIYVYKSEDFSLLHTFKSKQQVYDTINIHHVTLNKCLNSGDIYLNAFFFSLDLIEESTITNQLDLNEIKNLVIDKRNKHVIKHPKSKAILAVFKDDTSKNMEFSSLNSLANYLKGDRKVISDYLKGNKTGYYRGVWKFSHKD